MYGIGRSYSRSSRAEDVDQHRRQRVAVAAAHRRQVADLRRAGRSRSRSGTSARTAPTPASRPSRRSCAHRAWRRRAIQRRPAAGEATRLPAGHVVVGIDLPVRMGDGRAHLGASVLEHEHVVDVAACPSCAVRSAHRSITLRALAEPSEEKLASWVGRVQHHLAALAVHRRPPVGEPPHVVAVGASSPPTQNGQPADGQVGACLAAADDVHDRSQHRVDTRLEHRRLSSPGGACRCRHRRGATRPGRGTRLIASPLHDELRPSVRTTTDRSAPPGAVQYR